MFSNGLFLIFFNKLYFFQELTNQEQERQHSISQLVGQQEQFVAQMNFGLQYYLHPLGEAVLSPADHKTLFQNIEQVKAGFTKKIYIAKLFFLL